VGLGIVVGYCFGRFGYFFITYGEFMCKSILWYLHTGSVLLSFVVAMGLSGSIVYPFCIWLQILLYGYCGYGLCSGSVHGYAGMGSLCVW